MIEYLKQYVGYAVIGITVILIGLVAMYRHQDHKTPTPPVAVEQPKAPVATEGRKSKHATPKKPRRSKPTANRKQSYTACYRNGLCYRQHCTPNGVCYWAWY